MSAVLQRVAIRDADAVLDALARGTHANLTARCRRGGCDVIGPSGTLVASGDLHDRPVAMARLCTLAGLHEEGDEPAAHLTLHEMIHGHGPGGGDDGDAEAGPDWSYRALVRAAALKAAFPEHVHTLLANHELAQIAGRGIVKAGVGVVEAFNRGVEMALGEAAPRVLAGLEGFIRSMPLALRCEHPEGDILCAHSLPGPLTIDRFDAGVLDRVPTEEDYQPRTGSAHLMVWGRGHTPGLLEDLARRLGVRLFILGHEHAPAGWLAVPPRALVLNSDHDHPACCVLDLARGADLAAALAWVRGLE